MGSNYFSFSAEERAPRSVVKTVARSLLVKEEGCPLVTFKQAGGGAGVSGECGRREPVEVLRVIQERKSCCAHRGPGKTKS